MAAASRGSALTPHVQFVEACIIHAEQTRKKKLGAESRMLDGPVGHSDAIRGRIKSHHENTLPRDSTQGGGKPVTTTSGIDARRERKDRDNPPDRGSPSRMISSDGIRELDHGLRKTAGDGWDRWQRAPAVQQQGCVSSTA